MIEDLTYVEIDLPYCDLTYGASPCTAVLGTAEEVAAETATGTKKCFNTKRTCQDRANFDEVTVTRRFSKASDHYPRATIEALESLVSISYTPAIISLGEDLGQRASVSATFRDHPTSDTGPGGDKYRADRDYEDPRAQGTFWGKFRARHLFIKGCAFRLIRGRTGQAISEMEVRHFIIESFDGPSLDGHFTITAKDALKMLDSERAQAPALSGGFLLTAVDDTDLEMELSPAGIGNEEYPLSGYVSVGGSEICSFTRDVNAGNDSNTKLLLHFDGIDGSTDIIDSSPSARAAPTVTGSIPIDTAQSKFGGSSAYFGGDGNWFRYSDHADWVPSGNFTIDLWARFETLADAAGLVSHAQLPLIDSKRWELKATAAGALLFQVVNSSIIVTMTSATGLVTTGVWYHIAVVKNGTNWRIYLDGVSVATVTDSDVIPAIAGDLNFGTSTDGLSDYFVGWMDEFRFSHVARWTSAFTPPTGPHGAGPDILDVVRGVQNTEPASHDAESRVQICLLYTTETAATIMADLAINYAGVPSSYIPLDSWEAEIESFQGQVYTAFIAEPTSVKTLWTELIQVAGLSVWWDDIFETIKLRVLREVPSDAAVYDRIQTNKGSFSSREQPATRISQVWTYFAQINPLKPVDDIDNYRSVAALVDLEAETDYGSAAIKKRFARWISSFARQVALRTCAITLARFRDPPRRFTLSLPRSVAIEPSLGEGYQVEARPLQDDEGAPDTVPMQVTRLNPLPGHYEVEAQEVVWTAQDDFDPDARNIIVDTNTLDFNLRERYDAIYPDPDPAKPIHCIIEEGVKVGATLNSIPAFDVGDWPADIDITVTLQPGARIQGKGGDGGEASNPLRNGGTALFTRYDILLNVEDAEIWAGGAGGINVDVEGNNNNPGGSGGQGYLPGTAQTHTSFPGFPGTTEAPGPQANPGAGGYYPLSAGAAAGDAAYISGDVGGIATAIDGISYVTVGTGPGDIRGNETN